MAALPLGPRLASVGVKLALTNGFFVSIYDHPKKNTMLTLMLSLFNEATLDGSRAAESCG
jgi:hypothetical protein